LYSGEIDPQPEQDPLETLLEHDPPGEIDLEFARRLHSLAHEAGARYDDVIKAQLENWDISRLALIDLLLLRIALVEFESFPDIPHKVTLNEVIELAKRYSSSDASGFVNGVLDGILRKQAAGSKEP
jgi:N utilization substance protein B